jgi:hypothetical protein
MKTRQTSAPHVVRFRKTYCAPGTSISETRSVSFSNPLLPCCLLKIMSMTSSAHANTVADMKPSTLIPSHSLLMTRYFPKQDCSTFDVARETSAWFACGLATSRSIQSAKDGWMDE